MLKKILFIFLKISAFLFVLGMVYLFWLNIGQFNKTKLLVSKYIPTPIAISNSKILWINDFEKYLLTIYPPNNINIEVYNKKNWNDFFQAEKFKQLGLGNIDSDVKLKISFLKKTFASSSSEKIYNLINEGYKNDVSFSSLNQEYDQDPYSKTFFGDLGYLDSHKILPEILKELDNMNIGDIKPIASRYGWHIILLVDKDQKGDSGNQRFHLKQIFLNVSGFDQWLNQETNKINIFKLINY